MLDLVSGAHASGGASDLAYVVNRAIVGEHFALTKDIDDLLQAMTVMSGVNADPSSVARAIQAVDAFAAADAIAHDELIVAITGVVARCTSVSAIDRRRGLRCIGDGLARCRGGDVPAGKDA